MDKIKLFTNDDQFVLEGEVAESRPPWDGVYFGTRFFKFDQAMLTDDPYLRYVEGHVLILGPTFRGNFNPS